MAFTVNIKQSIFELLVLGKLRHIAGPLYNLMVFLEVSAQRFLDSVLQSENKNDQFVNENLTAVIKTFERPKLIKRCVENLKRIYPDLFTIVVDDSESPVENIGDKTIAMPYDSGISAGRNKGLEHVSTDYVLFLDDDHIIFGQTNLREALEIMDQNPEIDIMGAKVVNLPFFNIYDCKNGFIFPTNMESTFPEGTKIGGLEVQDKVENFFIARTDRLRLVKWDNELKRIEHADFFTRAKGILTTVYNPKLKCLHARNLFDLNYRSKRYDVSEFKKILRERYYNE